MMLECCVIRKVVMQSFHSHDNIFSNSHNWSTKKINDMSMSVKDEKISSEKIDLSMRVVITSDWRICNSSHQQCHQVIDEKISDKIVVLSLRVMTTVLKEVVTCQSRWYIEKTWVHLLYLTSSHTSIYMKNWELKRMIRTHSLLLIKVKHWTIAIAHLY